MSINPGRYVDITADGTPPDPQAQADIAAATQAGAIAGDIAGRAAGAEAGAAAGTEVAAQAGADAGARAGEIAGRDAGAAAGTTSGAIAGASAGSTSGAAAATALMAARTITGGGLATGGGALNANRVITVTEATEAEAQTGTSDSVVITPRRWLDAFAARTTAFTQSLLTAVDAAAARTALAVLSAAQLAAGTGAALVGVIAAGTGAVSRTLQAKLRDSVNVRDYGAVGDGVTNDTPAFLNAIAAAAGRNLNIPTPGVAYLLGGTLGTIPSGTVLVGEGRRASLMRKAFNGTLMTLADGAGLQSVRIDLQGATFTGAGVQILNGQGNQAINATSIINGDTSCVYFEKDGGSNFVSFGLEAYCVNPATAAVQVENTATGGNPRYFFNFTSGGNKSFSFGGANNFFVVNSAVFDCDFSPNNFDVGFANCRMAGTSGYTLQGSGSIMGGGLGPALTISAGAVWNVNPAYTNTTITDNSAGTSIVNAHNIVPYTPTMTAGGVAITLGSGTLIGRYSRSGKLVTYKGRLLPAADTVFPPGQLGVSLPVPTSADLLQVAVQGRLTDGGTVYTFSGTIAASGTVALFERDTSGSVTGTSPATLGAGDGLWFRIIYET